jgi:alpha-galactosidase
VAILTKKIKCFKEKNLVENVTIHEYRYLSEEHRIEFNPVWYQSVLPSNIKYCHYYKSGWGNEFRYVREEIGKGFILENTLGRSSAQYHPYFVLEDTLGHLYSYNLFYSGNWRFALENKYDNYELEIGFENEFRTTMKPGKEFKTPKVGVFTSQEGWSLLRNTWQKFTDGWMKKNKLQQDIPVAWNHWWAYEDAKINEEVFIQNITKAAELDVDVCVLDAGWFGNNQHWFDVRGDWYDVDKKKFPSGIAYLSEKVHEKGMKFGFWVEIEGLGKLSNLAITHPSFVAKREKNSLGYICFGNNEVVNWAVQTLSDIIETYNCDWIKFDFNLDPGYGCDCIAHGHGEADGLFEHYQGLYNFFSILNNKYPEVVFENCSSGGQRTDLGILSNMHFNFLSDPDYPVHKQRCVINAGEVLPSNRMYHFMPSQTCGTNDSRPFPDSDLASVDPKTRKLYTRLGMLTSFGISHRLKDYDEDVLQFLKEEINLFKEIIKPFIKDSFYHSFSKESVNIHVYKRLNDVLIMAFSDGMKDITVNFSDLGIVNYGNSSLEDIDLEHEKPLDSERMAICFNGERVKTYIIKNYA